MFFSRSVSAYSAIGGRGDLTKVLKPSNNVQSISSSKTNRFALGSLIAPLPYFSILLATRKHIFFWKVTVRFSTIFNFYKKQMMKKIHKIVI